MRKKYKKLTKITKYNKLSQNLRKYKKKIEILNAAKNWIKCQIQLKIVENSQKNQIELKAAKNMPKKAKSYQNFKKCLIEL